MKVRGVMGAGLLGMGMLVTACTGGPGSLEPFGDDSVAQGGSRQGRDDQGGQPDLPDAPSADAGSSGNSGSSSSFGCGNQTCDGDEACIEQPACNGGSTSYLCIASDDLTDEIEAACPADAAESRHYVCPCAE